MGIPFIDLKAQFKALKPDIHKALDEVLEHGRFIMGPEVGRLEKALAEHCGVKHAIACASGTDALLMPLMALGVGPGDAVFTTPFTFIATAEVASLLGATPVFVDVDPRTFNIDPEALEKAVAAMADNNPSAYPLPHNAQNLTPKAVISVDIFGQPADYAPIKAVTEKYGLALIEDAAQSFGSTYQDKKSGHHGLAAATSFFPAKPLGCYGDGGAILTNDDEMAETALSIRVHGKGSHKYDNARIGLNARLDTIQAAILLVKLAAFPEELAKRQAAAKAYTERINDIPGLTPPYQHPDTTSAWAQYSILADDRQAMQDALKQADIPTAVYYPKPLHMQTAFTHLGYNPEDMPNSHHISQHVFSLPMHPYLDEQTISLVCDTLAKACR